MITNTDNFWFKDAITRDTFYTKTKTIIGTKDFKIYEIIPAQRITIVKLEVENFKDVEVLGWEVIDANVFRE